MTARFYLLVGMTLISTAALGCSCAKPVMTLEEEIRRAFGFAAAIVQAQAIGVKDESGISATHKGPPPPVQKQRVTWQVTHAWKGSYEPSSTIESVTGGLYGGCGFTVKKGEVYILYLSGPMPFSLSTCGESKPLNEAAPEIIILDALANGAGA